MWKAFPCNGVFMRLLLLSCVDLHWHGATCPLKVANYKHKGLYFDFTNDMEICQINYTFCIGYPLITHEVRASFRGMSLAILNWPVAQFPQCTSLTPHNAPFRTEMCTFLFWMMHCGIQDWCIVGFVRLIYFVVWSVIASENMNEPLFS